MKLCILAVGVLLVFTNSVFGNDTFMHPSSWGVSEGDHYNTFTEDSGRICHNRGFILGIKSACEESRVVIDGVEYADRDCGYGGHCSSDVDYHLNAEGRVRNGN
jgi:hypothetical protein